MGQCSAMHTDGKRSISMSDAMIVASYLMIPMGVAAVILGAYQAFNGYGAFGGFVALLGVTGSGLAFVKLRHRSR